MTLPMSRRQFDSGIPLWYPAFQNIKRSPIGNLFCVFAKKIVSRYCKKCSKYRIN